MSAQSESVKTPKPAHVPAHLVVDFDFFHIPGSDEDVQLSYRAFQQSAPDIFWTPYNGGHWVATRAADIEAIQLDHARFSHRHVVLPKFPSDIPAQIPLEIDPPRHTAYRRPLNKALLPNIVNALEAKVHDITVGLIEALKPRGECEFVSEFGQVLPINVFLDLVDLPRGDREYLLPIADRAVHGGDVETVRGAQMEVMAYLQKPILERREKPGDDLLSLIVNTQIDGEKISIPDALNFSALVLFGGLDTVAAMLAFVARFLALNPSHRQQLIDHLDDDAYIKGAVEELLRRHGIANTSRIITCDFEYKGVSFREGDMILPPNLLVGLDERKVEDPLKVDFSRPLPSKHAVFGNGPHNCPGAILARRELKVFITEWLSRIPNFQIKPGTKPNLTTGMVNGISKLELSWPV